MNFEELKSNLKEHNILLSDIQIEQLKLYFSLLHEYNQKMNLTGIDDLEGVVEKHFFDSLIPAFHFSFTNQKLLDLGSGAGFPGMVLAIAFPELQVTLLEPIIKRCIFLEEVVRQLKLKNVKVVTSRAEDFVRERRGYYDVVTARAVSRLNILLELALPLLKENGVFIALKGKQAQEEIDESANALHILNGKISFVQKANLISENDQRSNIFVIREGKISEKYPRQYSQIKKKPL